MNIFELTLFHTITFLLILTRISSFMIVAPLFGARNIPTSAKAGFSFLLSLILLPVVKSDINVPPNLITFFSLVVKEIFVGITLAFASLLIFAIVQFAGYLIDMHMGFAIMNIIDPNAPAQVTTIGQISYLIAFLLFLIINGHHLVLQAFFQSFEIIPLTAGLFSPQLTENFILLTGRIFTIGLKIALPAIGIIFIAELSMGIIARTIPQINIFLVGFPLRIGLGLFIVGASIPFFIYVSKPLIHQIYKDIILTAKLLGGG